MENDIPILGYETVCEDVTINFYPQHQDMQPGMEYMMVPRPIFDNPNYIGSNKLKDKVAIITGGDSGIGRAVAIAFAKEGADIVVAYYNEHIDAEETKMYIEQLGRRCLLISGDVRDNCFCKKIVDDTINTFGRLDILINNAGVQFPQDSIEEISNEQLDDTFKINVYSYYYITKAALPYLKSGSTIISTTSITAYNGFKELIDYSATKGAVVSFTRALARSLVDKGIRVNAVAPGLIWSPLQVSSWDISVIPTFGSSTLMKRAGQPFELAPTYVYLASDDSTYVTGQVLHVDGGETMCS
jgi:NAD(P)-dependent dehydrogenase (short-subunit alcohol dehydrogenase family)